MRYNYNMQLWKSNKTYGIEIPDLTIHGEPAPYPVYNEREIRAAAGLMFVTAFFTFMYTWFTRDFSLLWYVVPLFWIDFLIKVLWGGEYSPFGILGAMMVRGQRPEYVGAIQKRFAWGIGFVMATLMLVLVLALGIRAYVPLAICGICILFMWMETSLGICVGCKIYGKLIDWKIIPEPEFRPACPGGVCSIGKKKAAA